MPLLQSSVSITKNEQAITYALWEDTGNLVYTIENTGTTTFYPTTFAPDIPDTWTVDETKRTVILNNQVLANTDLTALSLEPNDQLILSIPVTFQQIGTFSYGGTLKGTSDANRKYALPNVKLDEQSFEVKQPTLTLFSVPALDFGSNAIQSSEMTLTMATQQVIEGVDEYVNTQNWQLVANVSPLVDVTD